MHWFSLRHRNSEKLSTFSEDGLDEYTAMHIQLQHLFHLLSHLPPSPFSGAEYNGLHQAFLFWFIAWLHARVCIYALLYKGNGD
jgi:hypothetical protein